jgi:uncharacterized protein YggU (UPF0235/DUF167 family)
LVVSVRDSTAAPPLRLRVRVVPGARRSEVVGRLGDAWKLRVKAAPERGRANGELVALLARTLGVPRGAVRVARGHTTGEKLVEVDLLTREEAERRLVSAAELVA